MITAVILAAGESKRMDSPKALLRIGEETFASSIAGKARDCGVEFVYLIAGQHYQVIKQQLPKNLHIDVIFNLRYREGQLSSLKEGLRNLPTGSTEVIVWPVDQPLVQGETIRKLITAFQQERKHVTIPVYQSKRGHPVMYDLAAIHSVLSLNRFQTARDLQTIYANEICQVEVDDPGILIDIDTPEDYRRFIKDAGLSSVK